MLFLDSSLCTIRTISLIFTVERTDAQWGEGREKARIEILIKLEGPFILSDLLSTVVPA